MHTAMKKSRIKHFAVFLLVGLVLLDEIAAFGAASSSFARRQSAAEASHLLAQTTGTDTDTDIVSNVLPEHVEELKVHLDTGVNAQVFVGKPPQSTKLPPLVFLHGSFHAGWCWTEQFFPYFLNEGFPVVALSLRGTGGTFAGDGVKKVTIDEHAADLGSFLEQVPDLMGTDVKPVLISHSFGGLAVMKYLEQNAEKAERLVGGIITMCSVPPSGNGKMTLRFLKRSLVDSWKITAGFAMKRCIQNYSLCRDLFFGGTDDDNGVSDEDIERYQSYFARDTEAVIDIRDLLKHLPSKQAVYGKAPHVDKFPPCLVIGAERDFIVDREGVEETATYFGAEPLYVDSPHDVMLGRNWEITATTIQKWVQESVVDKQQ